MTAGSTGLAYANRLPNGVKAPDDGEDGPFSANQRALDPAFFRLDIDGIIGAIRNGLISITTICELKEIITSVHGKTIYDKPWQDAVSLCLARILHLRFLRAVTLPVAATAPTAYEFDSRTGAVSRTFFAKDHWEAEARHAAQTHGDAFALFQRAYGFIQYACDDRHKTSGFGLSTLVRTFAFPAVIVETLDSPKVPYTSSMNHVLALQIYAQLVKLIAPTQCIPPLFLNAHAATENGPWQLKLLDPADCRIIAIYDLPTLPSTPAKYPNDPGVKVWNHVWDSELQMRTRHRTLTDYAVQYSRREDGLRWCRGCLLGQCDMKLHKCLP